MRIAFVLCGDLASVSGGFLYDRQLISRLRAAGALVDVVSLPWWRSYPRALAANLAPWPFDSNRYDVVVEDQLCHAGVFLRNRWLRGRGVRLVSLVHNLSSTQPNTRARGLVRVVERAYFGTVDGVIGVCASTLADVRGLDSGGYAGLPTLLASPAGDHVVPLTADEVERRARAPGPLRLLFTGVVAPHKGLHRLLPVVAEIEGVRLDVAGGLTTAPGYVSDVKRIIRARGLSPRVTLHGQLDPAMLADLRAKSDVLVMPSDREAYPLAAIEGFAAGLPALLTNQGGTTEVMGNSEARCLIAPDDSTAWRQAITALADDRDRLALMSAAALARHAAHGTWAVTADKVNRFLRELRR
jgi:glycosyltransferase involved in cell wall biosynthesis